MQRGLELTRQAEASHFWFRGFRKFVSAALAEALGDRRDLRLIDCGCGTGFNLSLLAPYGKVVGFDLNAGLIEVPRPEQPIVRGDVTRIPFANDCVDVAASFDVLQCVEHDQAAIREMARIVKPGGVVIVTLAAFEALRGDHAISWNEFHRYTPEGARQLLRAAGLTPIRVSFTFASVFPVVASARLLQRLTRPFRELSDDADISVPAAPVNAVLTWLVEREAQLWRTMRMPIGSSILAVARKE